MKKILTLLSVFALLLLCSCSNKTTHQKTYSTYFGTVIQITIYDQTDKESEETFSEINKILSYYHELTDRYYNHGNIKGIYYINHHQNEVIEIDENLFDIINYSIELSDSFDETYFNILVGSLSDAYHDLFLNHLGEEIDESMLPVIGECNFNLNEIELNKNNHTIKIKNNMSLDLGGIAKGYVTDKVIEYLNSVNLKYVINAGMSSIYTNYGNPSRKNNEFIVGLTNPSNTSEAFYKLSAPLNKAISVSGDYQKYFKVGDRIYSHILDTDTKESVISDIKSITVISDSCALGDILSTTLFMMGSTKAISYMEENNLMGIIYKADNTYKIINIEEK